MPKTHPVVTLRPKAIGVLETADEATRTAMAFEVEVSKETLKGYLATARCDAGTFFPRDTYEEVSRKWSTEEEENSDV